MRGSSTSIRDRTADFAAIAERLQKQQGVTPTPPAVNGGLYGAHPAKQAVLQQSEFARKASQIGLTIHKTSVKLQKLAQLAKSSSLFDDRSAEIDELTGVVKQDIQALNSAIAELQQVSARGGDSNRQSQDHSHTVVDSLRSRLKDATAEFKDVLTLRTENLKVHQERKQQYSSTPDPMALERAPLLQRRDSHSGASSSGRSAHTLFGGAGSQVRQRHLSTGPGPSPPLPQPADMGQASSSGGRARGGGGQGRGGGGLQQQQSLVVADTYRSSRAEALHQVESTIVELGSIFTQLAEMVAAQGEMAQRIDENVEETMGNVDNAKQQLLRYLNNMNSNRWLTAKVLAVLIVFVVIFVVFIA